MGWFARLRERERARPKTKLDEWAQRHRDIVLRLPRWLVGTSIVSCIALGVWCAIYDRGLMPLFRHMYQPGMAAMATIAFTVMPCMLVLYAIARVVPEKPSSLPDARVRR